MEYRVIVNEKGTFWYKPNSEILHREGGPAVEHANGSKSWCQNGKRHRDDGPAIEWDSGYKVWYLFGKEVSEQDVKDYAAKKSTPTMGGKVIEIDGAKYKLEAV